MGDPIRALLIEMADELDFSHQCLMDDQRLTHPLADRARAALSAAPPEPVGEGEVLTDGPAVPEGREPASVVGELSEELVAQWIAEVWHEGTPVQVSASDLHLASKAAEWGARYGHQPAPPAEGEVEDRVAWLRRFAAVDWIADETADKLYAIADILSQRHPAPVPVSERLPGPGDCTPDGRCWIHQPSDISPESPEWVLVHAKYASAAYGTTLWAPWWALPLPQPPQGEEVG